MPASSDAAKEALFDELYFGAGDFDLPVLAGSLPTNDGIRQSSVTAVQNPQQMVPAERTKSDPDAAVMPSFHQIVALVRRELNLPVDTTFATTIARACKDLDIPVVGSLRSRAIECWQALGSPLVPAEAATRPPEGPPPFAGPEEQLDFRDVEEMTSLWGQEFEVELGSANYPGEAALGAQQPTVSLQAQLLSEAQVQPVMLTALSTTLPMAVSASLPLTVSAAAVPLQRQDTNESASSLPRPCSNCRRSKILCDRQGPCGRCTRLGMECTVPPTVRRGRPPRENPSRSVPEAKHAAGEGRPSASVEDGAKDSLDTILPSFAQGLVGDMSSLGFEALPLDPPKPALSREGHATTHAVDPIVRSGQAVDPTVRGAAAIRRAPAGSNRRVGRLATIDMSARDDALEEPNAKGKAREATGERSRTWHDDDEQD
jgi:hypothetical protein